MVVVAVVVGVLLVVAVLATNRGGSANREKDCRREDRRKSAQ